MPCADVRACLFGSFYHSAADGEGWRDNALGGWQFGNDDQWRAGRVSTRAYAQAEPRKNSR